MNKYIIYLFTFLPFCLFTACQPKTEVQYASQPADTLSVKPAKSSAHQKVSEFRSANKGRIESVRETPVCSRMAEQIVMFAIEGMGQYVKKGQVVARLSDAALREKILNCRARFGESRIPVSGYPDGTGL